MIDITQAIQDRFHTVACIPNLDDPVTRIRWFANSMGLSAETCTRSLGETMEILMAAIQSSRAVYMKDAEIAFVLTLDPLILYAIGIHPIMSTYSPEEYKLGYIRFLQEMTLEQWVEGYLKEFRHLCRSLKLPYQM